MNMPMEKSSSITTTISQAINFACDTIAPTWPLDRMIAVSPYWQRIDKSFADISTELATIAGSPMTMDLPYYKDLWQKGNIKPQHLQQAITEAQSPATAEQAIVALQQTDVSPAPAPLLCDALDNQRNLQQLPAWCDTITHQIAQFCAAYFDRDQADWQPDHQQALYASWRKALARDHSVAVLIKSSDIPNKALQLEADPELQIAKALQQLAVPPEHWPSYLQAVIMRVSGWASWCAYRSFQANLNTNEDTSLVDLLAIRLSWECLIDDNRRQHDSVWAAWQNDWLDHFKHAKNHTQNIHLLWQRAHEVSYQNQLFQQLTSATKHKTVEPKIQAVFCIDVRSEVFRRNLEAQSNEIQTLGFAGFFGLPISYTPLATQATRPQLPGLLAPVINITDAGNNPEIEHDIKRRRQSKLGNLLSLQAFKTTPASTFTLVETLGLGYAGKLIKRSLTSTAPDTSSDSLGLSKADASNLRPSLDKSLAGDLTAKASIASQVLTGMNLTEGLAPVVLLVGHGSQSQNNPQRAGLDCGACCGQSGEVNARALAGLLNDEEVRKKLAENAIVIPAGTQFLSALHNTTTDDVSLFDTEKMQQTHQHELTNVVKYLAKAGQATRQERAHNLGLQALADKPEKLTKAIKQRANDWAQTRPEWGLANNAAFIVAPRHKTRNIDLQGRSFLHEYEPTKDLTGDVLEQIMTAPMLVTHWINMQYHGSTVDNKRYGSGNKTLHNVTGGRLGVFEGNGGDLRIGLAWQSVNDGNKWQHEPLRLTVVIDAPEDIINQVIAKHPMIKNLLDNQWLYLARFNADKIALYHENKWRNWANQE